MNMVNLIGDGSGWNYPYGQKLTNYVFGKRIKIDKNGV